MHIHKRYICITIVLIVINRLLVYLIKYCHYYCYCCGVFSSQYRNLDEVFTYNHMDLMSLRSRTHVNASMILTRADHLFIYNHIRYLSDITSKYYFKTYFNGADEARTRVLLFVCLTP